MVPRRIVLRFPICLQQDFEGHGACREDIGLKRRVAAAVRPCAMEESIQQEFDQRTNHEIGIMRRLLEIFDAPGACGEGESHLRGRADPDAVFASDFDPPHVPSDSVLLRTDVGFLKSDDFAFPDAGPLAELHVRHGLVRTVSMPSDGAESRTERGPESETGQRR